MHAFVRQLLAGGAGAALIVVAGLPAGAQSGDPAASAQPQHTLQMVPALASLDHTLDAKKAKQGDPVTAKIQKDVKISQEQILPKNTVLEGHVDQVEPSVHRSDSTVVVTFDKAKLKSGEELPIKATVMEIAEPVSMMQQPAGESAGSGMPGGGGSMPSGGAPRGGGAAPSTSQSEPAPQPMEPSSQPSAMQPAQRNGVPGVMLQSDIHQQASATFTSKGRNVHLPDGTQMDVALAVIPAGTQIQ